jgi:hypothetical protein
MTTYAELALTPALTRERERGKNGAGVGKEKGRAGFRAALKDNTTTEIRTSR